MGHVKRSEQKGQGAQTFYLKNVKGSRSLFIVEVIPSETPDSKTSELIVTYFGRVIITQWF